MPTFREKPKPLEVVDARPFLGTHQSAYEIVDWFMAHDNTFKSYEYILEITQCRLIIYSVNHTFSVVNGSCVVLKQNGRFTVMTEAELFQKYEQV